MGKRWICKSPGEVLPPQGHYFAEETLGEAIIITFDQEAEPSTGDLRDKERAYIKLRVTGHGAVRFTLK